jgi:hypothetical protein
MGLLDDAIREHLELKRLRGADPGDVAREEQAALGAVLREGAVESDGPSDSGKDVAQAERSSLPDRETDSPPNSVSTGQETVEINMEAELAAGAEFGGEPGSRSVERAAPMAHPTHAPDSTEDSLEWEMPGDRRDESASGDRSEDEADNDVAEGQEVAASAEDVLEETPDFLRDTPEQERLWFEQRPPRDFDFNE